MNPVHKRYTIPSNVMAAALTIAVPMVAAHEGVWLTARPDRLAYGIPTVCFGETEGVKIGERYTMKQCQDQLAKKLPRYENEIAVCINVPVSAKMLATYIDFAYNLGSGAFCKSSAVRRLNMGDYELGCDLMRPYVNSGGQFRQGLLNRRIDEIKACHDGIADLKAGRL